jgi:hypothetical protein
VAANKVYQLLDEKQRKRSMVEVLPSESAVAFRGRDGKLPGLPVAEMDDAQKKALQSVLQVLVEPFRKEDQDETILALKRQGGLDACTLTFYKAGDIGNDSEWDNWRLEGPSFVWYFRGSPHVHVWVNVADNPSVTLNARG